MSPRKTKHGTRWTTRITKKRTRPSLPLHILVRSLSSSLLPVPAPAPASPPTVFPTISRRGIPWLSNHVGFFCAPRTRLGYALVNGVSPLAWRSAPLAMLPPSPPAQGGSRRLWKKSRPPDNNVFELLDREPASTSLPSPPQPSTPNPVPADLSPSESSANCSSNFVSHRVSQKVGCPQEMHHEPWSPVTPSLPVSNSAKT